MIERAAAWLVCGVMLTWGGCAAPPDRYDPAHRPGDFTLRLTLTADADSSAEAMPTEPGQYVVTPDRVMRVALGRGAHAGLYPGRTGRLTRREMDRLWRLTLRAWRAAANGKTDTTPGPTGLTVDARFRAGSTGRSFRGSLRSQEMRELVAHVVAWRGGAVGETQ